MIETQLKGKITRKVASQNEGQPWDWRVLLIIQGYSADGLWVQVSEQRFKEIEPGSEYVLAFLPVVQAHAEST